MDSRHATIVDTYLGYWTDDILVSFLIVDFGGAIMGIGGDLLNSSDPRANRAYGVAYAQRMMRACGVHTWHDLDGVSVNVLFDRPFPAGRAIGVESLTGAPGERFVFAELTAADLRLDQEHLHESGILAPLHGARGSRLQPELRMGSLDSPRGTNPDVAVTIRPD